MVEALVALAARDDDTSIAKISTVASELSLEEPTASRVPADAAQ
jgi:hypothetical protein